METYVELDTHLPDHYRMLKENLHRFAREVMRPTAAALDRLADPGAVIAPGSPLWDFLKQAYRLGYNKAGFPTQFGGLGLSGLGQHIYLEELGWGSADLALTLGLAGAPFGALAATGNRELIEKYVVPFIQDREAQYIGCWPVTEPQHGSDWVTGLWDRDAKRPGGPRDRPARRRFVRDQRAKVGLGFQRNDRDAWLGDSDRRLLTRQPARPRRCFRAV